MNLGAMLTVVLVLLRACSFDEPDRTAGLDAGAARDAAAAGDMALPAGDDGALYADPSRAAGAGEVTSPEPGTDGADAAIASCFDGVDSDGDDLVDCADPDCLSSIRSCCAGRGDCCETSGTETFFASPDALAGCTSDPTGCLAATPFGEPGPYVADGLSGGGDGVYDSGLLFDDTVDTSAERVAIRAELALPVDCPSGCMESVAFGLTRQASLDGQSHVRPILGLILAPSRSEVTLMAGDRTLGRWPAAAGDWAIVATPEGVVGVESPTGSEPVAERFVPTSGAHLVVWGHNANPSATASAGARLRALALERALCDMPRAWRPAEAQRDGAGELSVADRASIAPWNGGAALAFERDGIIVVATRTAGETTWAEATTLAAPGVALSDPELVPVGGELALFVAMEGPDGSVLGRSSGTPTDGFGAPTAVLDPAALGVEALRGATIATRPGDPSLVMLAQAEGPEGARSLHAFASSSGGATWAHRGSVALPPLADAEELGGASLTVHDGVYLLYLAIRRGTRWRLAHLASDDFVHWRIVDDAALVGGQLAPLGARAPDAMAIAGGVELVYLGVDGVEPTLLGTWRPATDFAILPSP